MSRAAVRMNRVRRLTRHLTLDTHHVPFDAVGAHARVPTAVCGAAVGPDEIALHGIMPTCPNCKAYRERYDPMEIQ